jgi:hypothetical protein
MSGLKKRVDRLGRALRGEQCPRCTDTTVILVGGQIRGVIRGGRPLTEHEIQAYMVEEVDGCCGVCGEEGEKITVGPRLKNRPW